MALREVRERAADAVVSRELPGDQRLIPGLIAAICAAELVVDLVHIGIGALLQALVLVAIVILQARTGRPTNRRALVPLALVPLLRLLSLTVPLPGVPVTYWVAIVGAPLLGAGLLAARAAGLGPRQLGLTRGSFGPQAAVMLFGVPVGLGAALVAPDAPWIVESASAGQLVGVLLVLVVFVAFTEELIFRGVIQGGLGTAYSSGAVPLTALLYGTSYLGSLSFEYTAYMAGVGLVYGAVAQRTGSILGTTASHAILVIVALVAYPLFWGGG